jgi:transposase InsO family protein
MLTRSQAQIVDRDVKQWILGIDDSDGSIASTLHDKLKRGQKFAGDEFIHYLKVRLIEWANGSEDALIKSVRKLREVGYIVEFAKGELAVIQEALEKSSRPTPKMVRSRRKTKLPEELEGSLKVLQEELPEPESAGPSMPEESSVEASNKEVENLREALSEQRTEMELMKKLVQDLSGELRSVRASRKEEDPGEEVLVQQMQSLSFEEKLDQVSAFPRDERKPRLIPITTRGPEEPKKRIPVAITSPEEPKHEEAMRSPVFGFEEEEPPARRVPGLEPRRGSAEAAAPGSSIKGDEYLRIMLQMHEMQAQMLEAARESQVEIARAVSASASGSLAKIEASKMPKFSGADPEDYEPWVRSYERLATAAKWSERQALYRVEQDLTGIARTMFHQWEDEAKDTDEYTWLKFKAYFKQEFVQPDLYENYYLQALTLKQEEIGSVGEYFVHYKELLRKSKKAIPEKDQIVHLKKGLHPRIRPSVAAGLYDSVMALKAAATAVELALGGPEAFKRNKAPTTPAGRLDFKRRSTTTSPGRTAFTVETKEAETTCKFCKSRGHEIDECRKLMYKEGKCFICRLAGHRSADCPKRPQELLPSKSPTRSPKVSTPASARSRFGKEDKKAAKKPAALVAEVEEEMSPTTAEFNKAESSYDFVNLVDKARKMKIKLPIFIKGNRGTALIDSGATCTLVSKSFFDSKLRKHTHIAKRDEQVFIGDGKYVHVQESFLMKLIFKGRVIEREAFVFPTGLKSFDVLIGNNFLDPADAVIAYGQEPKLLTGIKLADKIIGSYKDFIVHSLEATPAKVQQKQQKQRKSVRFNDDLNEVQIINSEDPVRVEVKEGFDPSLEIDCLPEFESEEEISDLHVEEVMFSLNKEQSTKYKSAEFLQLQTKIKKLQDFIEDEARLIEEFEALQAEISEPEIDLTWEFEDATDVPDLSQKVMPYELKAPEDDVKKTLMQNVQDNENLTADQKKIVSKLLLDYADRFAVEVKDLEQTDLAECKIELNTDEPIRHRPYRTSKSDEDFLDGVIKSLLDAGLIRRSNSRYASPVVIAKAVGRDPRFCIDYRKLNSKTKRFYYPLPIIDQLFTDFIGSQWFTSVDLKSGYWQVRISEDDKSKTAFCCKFGVFEWNVMPFGLMNAPAVFQEMSDKLIQDIQAPMGRAYIDDLTLGSKDFESMLESIKKLLQACRTHKLKLHPKKCHFFAKKINLLGHVIDSIGVRPQDKIVKRIKSKKRPESVQEVRSFIGLVQYYNKFIENYSERALPLTDIIASKEFEWTEACEQAYIDLRDVLNGDEVLIQPDWNKEFILETDASTRALGAVLNQVSIDGKTGEEIRRPIAFASKKLSPTQSRYSVPKRECLGVIWAIKRFDYYLSGRRFKIITDHESLRWLKTLEDPKGIFFTWTTYLNTYDYTIEHRPGADNGNADALSRFEVLYSYEDMKNYLIERKIDEDLPTYEKRKLIRESKKHKIDGSQLQVLDDGVWKITPHPTEREQLIRSYHMRIHDPYSRVAKNLKLKYKWPGIEEDCQRVVQACTACARGSSRVHQKTKMKGPVLPWNPFAYLQIDLCGPFAESKCGNKLICVIIDYLTRYAVITAIPNKEAATIAVVLIEKIFKVFGAPMKIQSDRGTEFNNELLDAILDKLEVTRSMSSAYHPMSQGAVEKFNKTMQDGMSRFIPADKMNEWDVYLSEIQFAYNTSVHSTIGVSPAQMLFGFQPKFVSDVVLGWNSFLEIPKDSVLKFYKNTLEQRRTMIEAVQDRVMARRTKLNEDRKDMALDARFSEGCLVMRKNPRPSKTSKPWIGPYVLNRINDKGGLELLDEFGVPFSVNQRDCKVYAEEDAALQDRAVEIGLPLYMHDEDYKLWKLNDDYIVQAKKIWPSLKLEYVGEYAHPHIDYFEDSRFMELDKLWPRSSQEPSLFVIPGFNDVEAFLKKVDTEGLDVVALLPVWTKRRWWKTMVELNKDLPILVPRGIKTFSIAGTFVGRAKWHCVIVRLGNLPRRATEQDKMRKFIGDQSLEGYADLEVNAWQSDIDTLLEDLDDRRRDLGIPVLREEEVLEVNTSTKYSGEMEGRVGFSIDELPGIHPDVSWK